MHMSFLPETNAIFSYEGETPHAVWTVTFHFLSLPFMLILSNKHQAQPISSNPAIYCCSICCYLFMCSFSFSRNIYIWKRKTFSAAFFFATCHLQIESKSTTIYIWLSSSHRPSIIFHRLIPTRVCHFDSGSPHKTCAKWMLSEANDAWTKWRTEKKRDKQTHIPEL